MRFTPFSVIHDRTILSTAMLCDRNLWRALPASVAPGLSAPAGLGVPAHVILAACQAAAASGKLRHADVVELNPAFDVDSRTARTAARLIHTILSEAARTR